MSPDSDFRSGSAPGYAGYVRAAERSAKEWTRMQNHFLRDGVEIGSDRIQGSQIGPGALVSGLVNECLKFIPGVLKSERSITERSEIYMGRPEDRVQMDRAIPG
jgi:hypothetical protein